MRRLYVLTKRIEEKLLKLLQTLFVVGAMAARRPTVRQLETFKRETSSFILLPWNLLAAPFCNEFCMCSGKLRFFESM